MRSNRKHTPSDGFTLLELMLAVVLLAAAMTALYFAWDAGLKSWKAGSEEADNLQKTRAILDGIGEMLRASVLYDQSDEDEENDDLYLFEGIPGTFGEYAADSVTFVTLSSKFLRPYEAERMPLRRVRLALEQDEERQPYLALYSQNALATADVETVPQKLSGDVVGFRVRYYDADLEDWYEEWVDEIGLPGQVEVTLTYQLEDGSLIEQQIIAPIRAREAEEEDFSRQDRRSGSRSRPRTPAP